MIDIVKAKAALTAKRKELEERSRVKPTIQRSSDSAENTQLRQSEEMISLERSADARVMAQIDAALEAIELGEYATCLDCEEPISEKRLAVVPWALRCVGCQARHERRRDN